MSEMSDPAGGAFDVIPSDSTVLSGVRALYIGGAGNVSVTTPNRTASVVFTGVPAGTILPVRAVRVNATNTTATAIIALT